MRTKLAALLAAVPILALILGLPFVNRTEPMVLGLPFLLAWFVGWVLATPVFLAAAYWLMTTGWSVYTPPAGRRGRR